VTVSLRLRRESYHQHVNQVTTPHRHSQNGLCDSGEVITPLKPFRESSGEQFKRTNVLLCRTTVLFNRTVFSPRPTIFKFFTTYFASYLFFHFLPKTPRSSFKPL